MATYSKIEHSLYDNPKIVGLSCEAFRAYVEGILYSGKNLTDGFLDERIVARMWGTQVADELTTNDPVNPSWQRVEGGWMIYGFTERQTTKAEVDAMREQKSRAGKASVEAKRNKKTTQNQQSVEQSANTGSTQAQPDIDIDIDKELNVANEIRNDVLTLCEFLADKIEDNGSKRPIPNKQWFDAARLMLDRDRRDYIECKQLIIWCQENTFWRANILSMPKFREKYDQLRLQREKELTPPDFVVNPPKRKITGYAD